LHIQCELIFEHLPVLVAPNVRTGLTCHHDTMPHNRWAPLVHIGPSGAQVKHGKRCHLQHLQAVVAATMRACCNYQRGSSLWADSAGQPCIFKPPHSHTPGLPGKLPHAVVTLSERTEMGGEMRGRPGHPCRPSLSSRRNKPDRETRNQED
jgi:hypothetical protein